MLIQRQKCIIISPPSSSALNIPSHASAPTDGSIVILTAARWRLTTDPLRRNTRPRPQGVELADPSSDSGTQRAARHIQHDALCAKKTTRLPVTDTDTERAGYIGETEGEGEEESEPLAHRDGAEKTDVYAQVALGRTLQQESGKQCRYTTVGLGL
jgi:hypothetical protein